MNWHTLRLVVFDVDGTLYDQRQMRRRMLAEMAAHVVLTGTLTVPRVLRIYRQEREALAEQGVDGFEETLIARTAGQSRVSPETVGAIVGEWMEHRPLRHLRACRYPHSAALFEALRRRGKIIGVFSDYPAVEKLGALGLSADHVVAAGDEGVGILKPHPRGLEVLMQRAGASPPETVLIGDRAERDGYAARQAGAAALIRSNRPLKDWVSFESFADPVFAPVFDE